jgi:hypothetical protein
MTTPCDVLYLFSYLILFFSPSFWRVISDWTFYSLTQTGWAAVNDQSSEPSAQPASPVHRSLYSPSHLRPVGSDHCMKGRILGHQRDAC